MKLKSIIETEILSNGMDGEGIARVDGKVVFVPYTLAGERVRAVIKTVKKKYASASVVKILEPSPHRVTPDCPHYYKCGGCDTAHIDAEYRKNILISELENNFKKIAGVTFSPRKFNAAQAVTGCRNKMSMPFGTECGKVVLGLYRHNTHVVERVVCGMQSVAAQKVADIICEFANETRLSVYDESSDNGLLRHLVLREVGGRMSVTLVVNGNDIPGEAELASRLPENCDFFICPNMRKTNVIMGETVRLVSGNARLPIDVMGVKAELSPLAFLQVNDAVRDMLYAAAMQNLTANTLIDLYSGIGITSNLAANRGARVFAVECVPQAVADANRTAELNGNSDKIENLCGDVEKLLPLIVDRAGAADVLVDPPRKGCGDAVMQAIAAVKPQTLVYISCNHATMCRDIKCFIAAAPEYEIADCEMFDMFPGTHHVETLVCLKRTVR